MYPTMPHHDRIIIVASGPTASGFRPPNDLPVIAVIGVIEWIKRADYWFTLDPSQDNMRRMRFPRPGVIYYCACPNAFDLPRHVVRLMRMTGNGKLHSLERLSTQPGAIHTGNSAYGPLVWRSIWEQRKFSS